MKHSGVSPYKAGCTCRPDPRKQLPKTCGDVMITDREALHVICILLWQVCHETQQTDSPIPLIFQLENETRGNDWRISDKVAALPAPVVVLERCCQPEIRTGSAMSQLSATSHLQQNRSECCSGHYKTGLTVDG